MLVLGEHSHARIRFRKEFVHAGCLSASFFLAAMAASMTPPKKPTQCHKIAAEHTDSKYRRDFFQYK